MLSAFAIPIKHDTTVAIKNRELFIGLLLFTLGGTSKAVHFQLAEWHSNPDYPAFNRANAVWGKYTAGTI
jgi:hypothetical protein